METVNRSNQSTDAAPAADQPRPIRRHPVGSDGRRIRGARHQVRRADIDESLGYQRRHP